MFTIYPGNTAVGNKSKFSQGNVDNIVQNDPSKYEDNTIILIQPVDKVKQFFQNDLKLHKIIKESLFERMGILDVSKNLSRSLLVIKLRKVNKSMLDAILKVDSLGEYRITCRLPDNRAKSRGVFGPIGLETDEAELRNALMSKNSPIIEVTRLKTCK